MYTGFSRKYLWIPVLIYGLPNLIGAVTSYAFGVLLVDMVPVRLRADAWNLVVDSMVVLFSFFLLVAVIGFATRLEPRRTVSVKAVTAIGQIIFILQLVTLAAVVFFNYGRVGAGGGSAGALGIIASYLKADLLFMIYYGHVRPNSFPKYNFALYVTNSILQGWSGFWLILFLVELYYILERGMTRAWLWRIGIIIVLGLAALPFVNAIKDRARGTETADLSYLTAYVRLLNRLQLTTNVALIAQERRDIQADYGSGRIQPWYMDNGLAVRLIRNKENSQPLQKYVTSEYLIDYQNVDFVTDDIYWYTNVGLAGWLFVIPWYEMPFYLVYVSLLIGLPYWMVHRFLSAPSLTPVLHAASFIYALHGWLTVQFAFVVALGVYILLTRLLPRTVGHGRMPNEASRQALSLPGADSLRGSDLS